MRSSRPVYLDAITPPIQVGQASHSDRVPWGSVRASTSFHLGRAGSSPGPVRGNAGQGSWSLVRQPHGTKVSDAVGKGLAFLGGLSQPRVRGPWPPRRQATAGGWSVRHAVRLSNVALPSPVQVPGKWPTTNPRSQQRTARVVSRLLRTIAYVIANPNRSLVWKVADSLFLVALLLLALLTHPWVPEQTIRGHTPPPF
jgi:hypothetical protein